MRYRVKFKCYHYNTGAADNCYYINREDFDTLEEATAFNERIAKQINLFADNSDGWIQRNQKWIDSDQFIEIEDGFIEDYGTVVKFYPETEESL